LFFVIAFCFVIYSCQVFDQRSSARDSIVVQNHLKLVSVNISDKLCWSTFNALLTVFNTHQ